MKKLMSLMIGAALVLGTSAFAQDPPKKEETKKEGKKGGKGGKKKGEETKKEGEKK
jgi:hypothetical protein